jgi:hypothetical protein
VSGSGLEWGDVFLAIRSISHSHPFRGGPGTVRACAAMPANAAVSLVLALSRSIRRLPVLVTLPQSIPRRAGTHVDLHPPITTQNSCFHNAFYYYLTAPQLMVSSMCYILSAVSIFNIFITIRALDCASNGIGILWNVVLLLS